MSEDCVDKLYCWDVHIPQNNKRVRSILSLPVENRYEQLIQLKAKAEKLLANNSFFDAKIACETCVVCLMTSIRESNNEKLSHLMLDCLQTLSSCYECLCAWADCVDACDVLLDFNKNDVGALRMRAKARFALHPTRATLIVEAVEDLQRASSLLPNDTNIQRELQVAHILLSKKKAEESTVPRRISSSAPSISSSPSSSSSSSSSSTAISTRGRGKAHRSSPGNSRHICTDVGIDADAEYDDAAKDMDAVLRTLTDFTNMSSETIQKYVIDGCSRIGENCTLLFENKRLGMVSESNKLLTRIGLMQRDLLVFVRRVRRHWKIVLLRKQLDWLQRMSCAALEEITAFDIADHDAHVLFVEACKDFMGPTKEELMSEELADVEVFDDDTKVVFDDRNNCASASAAEETNDASKVLMYESSLLRMCRRFLDTDSEETSLSEDFLLRFIFHLRFKETITLTQKLLFGYSRSALVEMINCRVEYHKKKLIATEMTPGSSCQEDLKLNDVVPVNTCELEGKLSLEDNASTINLLKKKTKKKTSQNQKRKIDANALEGGASNQPASKSSNCESNESPNNDKKQMLRRSCARCVSKRCVCKCFGAGKDLASESDWAYEEIISSLHERAIDSLTTEELISVLVRAMSEDVCDVETNDGQWDVGVSEAFQAKRSPISGVSGANANTVELGLPDTNLASYSLSSTVSGESSSTPPNSSALPPMVVSSKPNDVDDEKRIFDMLIERYGKQMEHSRLDYYFDYLRTMIRLGIFLLIISLIALHFVDMYIEVETKRLEQVTRGQVLAAV